MNGVDLYFLQVNPWIFPFSGYQQCSIIPGNNIYQVRLRIKG